ncbi:MAG TPA: hypothetical protein V6C57_13710, partial [Coleofasciculaceae cyanobacterium]
HDFKTFVQREGTDLPLKALLYSTKLLAAVKATPALAPQLENSEFVAALMDLGKAYANLDPAAHASGDEPLNFFLDTLWNAQSEADLHKGGDEMAAFINSFESPTAVLGYETRLLKMVKQVPDLPVKQDTAFLNELVQLGETYAGLDPVNEAEEEAEPLNFFLDTLWRSDSEGAIGQGSAEFKALLEEVNDPTRLLKFETDLLEVAQQTPELHDQVKDTVFLRELVGLGKAYAAIDPVNDIVSDDNLQNTSNDLQSSFLNTLWSANNQQNLQLGAQQFNSFMSDVDDPKKLIKFTGNLLNTVNEVGKQAANLQDQIKDATFLKELTGLGKAYAAIDPANNSEDQNPSSLFLNTIWNAQNEFDILSGNQQIFDFLKDSSSAYKLISFSKYLLENVGQSDSSDKRNATFLKNMLEFGKAYITVDPLDVFEPSGSLNSKQLDPNDWLNVSPEFARQLLRSSMITGFLTGFANDLLQYALDSADTAPWEIHSPERNDRTKIAPPLLFDSNSEFSQAIVRSNQFQEEMRRAVEGNVANAAQDFSIGEKQSLPISGHSIPLNYRDGRNSLSTPRLSVSIGYAEVKIYNGEASIEKTTSTTAKYEAQVSGFVGDLYDFNNPKDDAVRNLDSFALLARLAFIAQSGGTLAIFDYTVDVEAPFQGGILLTANPR